jgi:methionyl aminopeptidase
MSKYLGLRATLRHLSTTKLPGCHKRTFFSLRKEPKPYTVITKNGNIAPPRFVPETIPRPSYLLATDHSSTLDEEIIPIRMADEIAAMREAGRLTRRILEEAGAMAQQGNITTNDIDEFVHERAIGAGAYPSTLHYNGFPKSIVSTCYAP